MFNFLCMIILLVTNFFPFVREIMSLSWRTPWGIITSILVHHDIEHFLLNFQAMMTFLLFYILLNMINQEMKINGLSFYFSPFISAILANMLSLLIFPEYTSLGASGVYSAMEGYDFALALTYLITNFKNIKSLSGLNKKIPAIIFNSFIMMYIFLDILFSPTYSRGSSYNSFVHWISFFINFIVTAIIFGEELLIHLLFFCSGLTIFLIRYVIKCSYYFIKIKHKRYIMRAVNLVQETIY